MEANLQDLTIIKEAVLKAKGSKVNKILREESESYYYDDLFNQGDEGQENIFTHIMLPSTRSMAKRTKHSKGRSSGTTPIGENQQALVKEDSIPVINEGRIKWKRVPREPIPQLSDINLWVGQQLRHTNMPAKYLNVQPKGDLIPMDSTYPEGLLAVPNAEGQSRIIVPPAEVKALILLTHEDIHHQNHIKVLHVLKATYYWPNMAKDIERWCLMQFMRNRHRSKKTSQNKI